MTAHPVPRANWGATLALFLLESSGAFLSGCRNEAPSSVTDGGSTMRAAETTTPAPSATGAASVAAPEQDVAPALTDGRRDGGTDPACEGMRLSLLASALDARCAISEREWNARVRAVEHASSADAGAVGRDAGGRRASGGDASNSTSIEGALRQEARRDGDRIALSIVNAGAAAVVVPLRYHAGHPELAFSVLAVPPNGGVFELAPAHDHEAEAALVAKPSTAATGRSRRWSTLAELDAGNQQRVHSALIKLLPGGRASARLVIDPRIVKRLDRTCPGPLDAGASMKNERDGGGGCMPARLAGGRVVLHVGQLIAGIDVGPPARVEWDAPQYSSPE